MIVSNPSPNPPSLRCIELNGSPSTSGVVSR
uniref:Uncharacterized protein n=1 Tax=Anopheles christyi TaxID=43041 RepID=A0A182KJ67_9DIPT